MNAKGGLKIKKEKKKSVLGQWLLNWTELLYNLIFLKKWGPPRRNYEV
jgi:hypothetical protein